VLTSTNSLYIQKDAAAIMDTFYGADGIFQPLSNSTFSLEEVAPTFSAQFDFQEVNQPAIQLNVELETSGLDGILYEKTHALWTRADRRDNSIPLGLFMIQLDG